MLVIFQLTLLAFIGLSLALVVGVPVLLASPEGWATSSILRFSALDALSFRCWSIKLICIVITNKGYLPPHQNFRWGSLRGPCELP